MASKTWTRRDVLKATGAALALPTFIPAGVLAKDGKPGANERVNVAIIGLGGRARGIAKTCQAIPEMRVVAICDCFAPLCGKFVNDVGKDQGWKTYTDFRQMIETEKLDGVMVETTTHARAWVAMHAMAMGMDAYIEKPMCLTIEEGRHMVNAARKHQRVTQIGTQQRSMPIDNWASDLVKNGKLGKVIEVLAPNFIGPDRWPGKEAQPMPAGGDDKWWDIWTNQAEMRPYHRELHRAWARWWAYDGGGKSFGVTGWGTHSYDQVQRALGTDETGPVEVVLEEPVKEMLAGKFEEPLGKDDTGKRWRRGIVRASGPRAKVRMKYADGTLLKLHLDADVGPGLGAIFVCEKATLELNRNEILCNVKEITESPDNPGPRPAGRMESELHIKNWVHCIKTRERCNADIEYGQRSSTVCYLANIARDVGLVGETLKWDPQAERFTNCDKGNTMVSRPRRKGWELPT